MKIFKLQRPCVLENGDVIPTGAVGYETSEGFLHPDFGYAFQFGKRTIILQRNNVENTPPFLPL